jgi:hypothetical protein
MKRKIIILSLVLAGAVLWALYCGAWRSGKHFLEERHRDREESLRLAREERLQDKVDHFNSTQDLPVPGDAEMVYWENQSWEAGGGSCRLTLWADGRSELLVDPGDFGDTQLPRPRNGWSYATSEQEFRFRRTQVFPAEEAIRLFRKVWRLGVQHIRPFEPNYVDGGGTVIAIQKAGNLTQVIVPEFPEERQLSEEHVRYLAVARHLAMFGLGQMAYEWNHGSQPSPTGAVLKAAPEE